jgi:hypothetical protein
MLEDDRDRVQRFATAVQSIDPSLELIVWHDAHRMIREVSDYFAAARLISLDHDLEPQPGSLFDPGDGVMVVKALVTHPQPCPVIIHSSNGTRSAWMAGDLELAGWSYRRVAPIGERWIEEYWRDVARTVLRQAHI